MSDMTVEQHERYQAIIAERRAQLIKSHTKARFLEHFEEHLNAQYERFDWFEDFTLTATGQVRDRVEHAAKLLFREVLHGEHDMCDAVHDAVKNAVYSLEASMFFMDGITSAIEDDEDI